MSNDNEESAAERQRTRQFEMLTANEKFAVQVVQVVAGGALVAVFAQLDTLQRLAPLLALYVFISVATVSLVLAVVAAYLRHQYQWLDIIMLNTEQGWATHHRWRNLTWFVLRAAVVLLVCDFVLLIGALWYRYLT